MEPRIKTAVIIGWMTSLPTTLDIPHRVHADMFDPVGVHAYLDHPDIASLAAPDCAIFVQNCAQNRLFTRAGMDLAAGKKPAILCLAMLTVVGRAEKWETVPLGPDVPPLKHQRPPAVNDIKPRLQKFAADGAPIALIKDGKPRFKIGWRQAYEERRTGLPLFPKRDLTHVGPGCTRSERGAGQVRTHP